MGLRRAGAGVWSRYRSRTAKPIALAGHRSGPYAAFSGSSYVCLWADQALLPLMPDEATHTPLPRSRSVVVEVTKIVDIDQPEVVIVDHVELVVAVLPRRTTPSRSHGFRSYRDETSVPCQTRGQGQTTKDGRRSTSGSRYR